MYLYIELWSPREAWNRLNADQRKSRLDQVLALAKKQPIPGVVPCTFHQVGDVYLLDGVTEQPIVVDDSAARPTGFRYASAWMIPTLELVRRFEKRVDALDWFFDCFEQQNAWGPMDAGATGSDMISNVGHRRSRREEGPGRLTRMEADLRALRTELDQLKKGVSA